MQRVQVRTRRRTTDPAGWVERLDALPLDPRDPDIVRAKRLRRRTERT